MPDTPASAARQILIRLHEVMASRTGAQAKLNKVVEIIGQSLSSEVCSIYLLREGMLELFATRGLKQDAVHVTRMTMEEGLVGSIARNVETLNLDEAAAHPDFAYRPETGEELFHSFAGVPIVRRENAVGVLCVQHVDPRKYEEVEIEALQTVAMVLSELISNAELVDEGPSDVRVASTGTQIVSGLQLVMGMARGNAVYHQPRITIEHTVAEDVEAERARVYSAFNKMREQIDSLAGTSEFGVDGEHQEVIETYKMFAYDEGWSRRINEAIDSGLTAEAAIERVQQRTRMRMRQIDDPLLQDRMHDLEDLANRLLRIVSGQLGTAAQLGLRQDTILIARNLGPAELLEYDRRRLKGVILEEGSLTAHVTIVARAMGVPQLYDPPAWLRHVNLVLMMIAMVLLAAFVVPGRIKAAVKHPMLAAIKVWALGHLLANGDLASVILFGSFLAWAVIDRIWLKRQPVDVIALEKARAAPAANDLIAVVIGATAFVLFAFWLHPALIGVAVM